MCMSSISLHDASCLSTCMKNRSFRKPRPINLIAAQTERRNGRALSVCMIFVMLVWKTTKLSKDTSISDRRRLRRNTGLKSAFADTEMWTTKSLCPRVCSTRIDHPSQCPAQRRTAARRTHGTVQGKETESRKDLRGATRRQNRLSSIRVLL